MLNVVDKIYLQMW